MQLLGQRISGHRQRIPHAPHFGDPKNSIYIGRVPSSVTTKELSGAFEQMTRNKQRLYLRDMVSDAKNYS